MSLSLDQLQELSDRYEKETKALKNELFRICWFMRGGLTISEAYELTNDDIEIISKIIKDNLETTKKSGMAFF